MGYGPSGNFHDGFHSQNGGELTLAFQGRVTTGNLAPLGREEGHQKFIQKTIMTPFFPSHVTVRPLGC